jgi:hypothetical protein
MATSTGQAGTTASPSGQFVVVPGFPRLYQLTPGDGQLASVYYIIPDTLPAQASPLTLAQTWAVSGWYVFVAAPIPQQDLAGVAALINAKGQITARSLLQHAFVWLAGAPLGSSAPSTWPAAWQWLGLQTQTPSSFITVSQPNPFPGFAWGQFGLTFVGTCIVTLDGAEGFTIVGSLPNALGMTFGVGAHAGQSIYLPGDQWTISLPISGATAGSLIFVSAIDLQNLVENFGLGFIYAYGEPKITSLYYPTVVPPANNTVYLTLQAYLNPVLPFAAAATRIVPGSSFTITRVPTVDYLPAPYFFTTQGVAVALEPVGPASPELPADGIPGCFAFSVAPPGALSNGSPTGVLYHLSPAGYYKLSVASPAPPLVDLMPGLSGLEFLRLEPGDLVSFVNNQPAYAPQFGGTGAVTSPPSPPEASGPLTATYTTSWVEIPPPASGTRGYFGQPSTSTYFGPPESGTPAVWQYPVAVESKLWTFEAPHTSVSFPLVPYGAVYQYPAASPAGVIHPAGQTVSAAELMAFEATVLASQRHGNLAQSPTGPMFMPLGATMSSSSLEAVTTPQGLLVGLKTSEGVSPNTSDGTWQSITLARQPSLAGTPALYLQMNLATAEPPFALANVLTRDQLFLVVSNPAVLGEFSNTLTMGGFEFLFDVGENAGVVGTILVVKFNDKVALRDLLRQPSLWADPATFVTDQAATLLILQNALEVATKPAADDPFVYFNELASTPSWTGILAFNVQIDGNGMPLDLQMLLGGIKGDLRAHHFGILTNTIDMTSAPPTITHSSLFGVIYYENPQLTSPASPASPAPAASPASPGQESRPDYEVEQLIVLFSNSTISQFHCTVGLTLNEVFGRTVTLQPVSPPPSPMPPKNTLEIAGRYQTHNGVGTVTFNSAQTLNYDYLPSSKPGVTRVLDRLEITGAQLVPISSTPATPGTDIQCAFRFEGQLWFSSEPFPGSGLDLYSYGNAAQPLGLQFTGISVNIAFRLGAEGSMVPGSKVVTLDESKLQPNPDATAIRPGSFLGSLPLQFSRFVSGSDLTASASGAAPVHCPQLTAASGGSPSTGSPATGSPSGGGGPSFAPTPQYAFEYDISLGSLGSLSDVQAGITAKLLLGWGPSPVTPDNDAASILVQLPQLSAGAAGFNLEGILTTQFGDANLVKVERHEGALYAVLFNNVQLSVFGYSFPPGVLIDFLLFAGPPAPGKLPNTSNLAWFLAAEQTEKSP